MNAKVNCIARTHFQSIFFTILLGACSTDQSREVPNKFNDPVVVQIGEQRFNNWRTHLYNSLDYPNPHYKTEAILAFASLGDNTAFSRCAQLLKKDSDQTVRLTAAFYLGELGGSESAKVLIEALKKEQDAAVKKQILIALAKTVDIFQVPIINDFTSDDNIAREGQCLSLIILKNKFYSDLKFGKITAEYLKDPKSSESVRFLSSYFLSIADSVEIAPQEDIIIQTIEATQNPEIASNLLVSLSKLQKKSNIKIFERYSTSSEWLVRTASLFGLRYGPSPERDHYFLAALNDSITCLKVTASEILKQNFSAFPSLHFLQEARKQNHWNARMNLFETAYLQSHDQHIFQEVADAYKNTSNPFEKTACIDVLSLSPQNYEFLKTELFKSQNPMIRTHCAMALVLLQRKKNFPVALKGEFVEIYQRAFTLGDPAVIMLFSQLVSDEELKYYEKIQQPQFLTTAYQSLLAQKEIQAAEAVEQVLSKIEGRESVQVSSKVKGPEWDVVKSISNDQRVLIKTSRGDIIVKLLVENAPVAVSNFLRLIDERYYDSTRVFNVTNSFIQSGCSRGDGFSQHAYTLPYEASITSTHLPTLNVTPIPNGFHATQWYISLNPSLNDVGNSLPIGTIETDLALLRRFEKGDTILSISRLQ